MDGMCASSEVACERQLQRFSDASSGPRFTGWGSVLET